jgi:thiosulfate reductase cytochrome b subunit
LIVGIATGRLRRKLLPIRPREVVRDFGAALTGRLSHVDLAVYNAVQKLLYLGVLFVTAATVVSGLALWKPVQLKELAALCGGYEGARHVHFLAMAFIVAFLAIHVAMALLVPRSLGAMIRGR